MIQDSSKDLPRKKKKKKKKHKDSIPGNGTRMSKHILKRSEFYLCIVDFKGFPGGSDSKLKA